MKSTGIQMPVLNIRGLKLLKMMRENLTKGTNKRSLNKNMFIEITHIQGGMREFERTGIYPEYLLFNLPGTRQNWRIRIKRIPQKGILKSKGKVVFEYSFYGHWCKFREVQNNGTFSKWIKPEFMMSVMRD